MTSFQELNASLKASSAQWVADETPLSNLTQAEKARRLGVVINRAALAKAMAPRAQVDVPKFDREVDWRNRNGNKVTPVKDQGGCGSCTSFSVVGSVESIALIELGRSLNLSEADLHFCSSHGATCDGWWPDAAYESFRTRGVTDEANFPYTNAFNGSNPVCNVSADRESHVVRITASTVLQSAVARKNWLTQVGPCVATFHVFDDFFSYRNGVYHHVSGSEVGLHNVVIIGYSEAEQCWICKNSWGTGWGMQGFFKIAYGAAGIDTEFPFWTARGVKLPPPPPDNGVRYDGIWVPAKDGRPIVWGWTFEDFQKKN
ncbi:C1 family peptidase, partial [Phormidesmis sp. 146-33]